MALTYYLWTLQLLELDVLDDRTELGLAQLKANH